MKGRISAIERREGQSLNMQGQILTLLGALNQRMDRFDERMGRFERRLDQVEGIRTQERRFYAGRVRLAESRNRT
jgi:hypothetical protein